jgi:cytochrome P450
LQTVLSQWEAQLSQLSYPPGPIEWRRTLLNIQKDPLQFLIQLQKDYGNFVHYRHGPTAHVYFVNTPELIREALVTQNNRMQRTNTVQRSLGKFLGNGLLVSSGDYHHQQRQLMQPLFASARVAQFDQLMVTSARKTTSCWHDGETRDLVPDMQNLTMNILYQTIFSTEAGNLGPSIRSAIETLQRYSGEMIQRTPQISEDECNLAIQKFNDAFDELVTHSHADSWLFLLLNSEMPHAQARDEVITLVVAGQETSAHGLAWLWYLLAQNPEIQKRIHEEVKHVLEGDHLTAARLEQMPLVLNTVRESLRLYPPAWLIGRSPTELVTLDGYAIYPEDTIIVSPYVLHHTAEYFPEPERFNPARFTDEPLRYTYLPFGAGPHICLGQPFAVLELALILATVITDWQFDLADDNHVEWKPLVTLQPAQGVHLVLHKRQN